MAELANNRNTVSRSGESVNDPVAANTHIFQGSIVMLDAAGNAVVGRAATGLKARGMACSEVVNGGVAGLERITSKKGVFRFANAGDITRAEIETTAYVVDDQTVAKAATGRSAAGTIVDVDDVGVWVKFD